MEKKYTNRKLNWSTRDKLLNKISRKWKNVFLYFDLEYI